ncbi:MAG TPA: acyl-CoA desaturase [Phycisphaerales bacterium]|nr:acyl-CoA desaturase [Phycisphaerales bacterium]
MFLTPFVDAIENEPAQRASFLFRLVNLLAVVVPFIGLVAAIVLLWGVGFGWVHLWLLVGGYMLTGLGVTVGYHRLFTHRSFRTNRAVTAVLGVLGSMAVEGPILSWVATHRQHHQHSDRDDDPHSPHGHGEGIRGFFHGLLHAHFGWLFLGQQSDPDRYVPDLQADPLVRGISRLFVLWVVLGLAIPAGIAWAVTGAWTGAFLGLLWGGLVRVFLVHHVTWSINSVCHLWGSRPYRTHDHSRNNPIFGVLGFGEGWHNNHHAFPASARHGLRWWQFDLSYLVIRGLALVRLARDVRVPRPEHVASKRAA